MTPVFAKGGFLPPAFIADFTQVVQSKINKKKVKKAPLKVKYAYPNNIYFEVSGNEAITYVCNSKKVWIYQPPFLEGSRGTLKVGDSSNFCYSKLFDVLNKGMKSNKHYTVDIQSKNHYRVKFSKGTANETGYQMIDLFFDKSGKKDLGAVETLALLPVNDTTPVKLIKKKFIKLKTFKHGTFDFKAPKNTDISTLK